MLINLPIRDPLDLERTEIRDPSTISKVFDRITMALCRSLLQPTLTLYELGDVAAINTSSLDRIAASRRYATQTGYQFRSLKTTLLVDCNTGAIRDVHWSTTQPHDTQIGWQVLTRNLDRLSTITADKGYDWEKLRSHLRKNDVRPVINTVSLTHSTPLTTPDSTTYHRRSVVESVFRILKQRYGDRLASLHGIASFANLPSNVPSKILILRSGPLPGDFKRFNTAT